ncbi:MAG: ABC transporter permease [Lachnospiraceae bacterium]
MEKIFALRQRLKQFFGKYDIYLLPILKFLVMFVVLFLINENLGYMDFLTRLPVMLILALICCLLPWSVMSFVVAAFTLLHLTALSWEASGIFVVFLFLAALMQYLFLPGFSIVIVLIPAAYYLHIPYVVPMILGLVGGAMSFIPAGMGVFAYYFLNCVQRNAGFLADSSSQGDMLETIAQHLTQLLSGLRDNSLMLLSIVAFCVVTALIQGIRRLSSDYAPYVAILIGAVANVLIFMLGGFTLNISVPYMDMALGTVFAVLIALIAQFWLMAVDYSRTEYLQYEDDNYIYYVKAVPKIAVTRQEIKVQEINARIQDDEDEDIRETLNILNSLEDEDK